jgi:hypothetical protein
MGADGGLIWMEVREPKKLSRVHDLLAPFRWFTTTFRDEDSEWIKKHPKEIDFKACIVTRYGTDLEHDGIHDLYEILAYMEDGDTRTFEDIILDLATRPDYEMYDLDTLDEALLLAVSWSSWYDYQRSGIHNSDYQETLNTRANKRLRLADEEHLQRLGVLRHLTVDAWGAELKRLLKWSRYHIVETWT